LWDTLTVFLQEKFIFTSHCDWAVFHIERRSQALNNIFTQAVYKICFVWANKYFYIMQKKCVHEK
jgi:hypothetical protein